MVRGGAGFDPLWGYFEGNISFNKMVRGGAGFGPIWGYFEGNTSFNIMVRGGAGFDPLRGYFEGNISCKIMVRGGAGFDPYVDKLKVISHSTEWPEGVADFIPHEEKINKCNQRQKVANHTPRSANQKPNKPTNQKPKKSESEATSATPSEHFFYEILWPTYPQKGSNPPPLWTQCWKGYSQFLIRGVLYLIPVFLFLIRAVFGFWFVGF